MEAGWIKENEGMIAFPGALDYLPRPGNREIRNRPQPMLPKIRMEETEHGGE